MKQEIPFRKRIITALLVLTLSVIFLLGAEISRTYTAYLKNNFLVKIDSFFESFKKYPQSELTNQGTALTIPVLLYHGIGDKENKYTMTQDQFRDEMTTLYANGYKTVSIDDFTMFMNGKKSLPAKSFLLTFDDGRKDSFYGADPILEKLGYNAVMFVATGQSLSDSSYSSSYYLNDIELKKMQSTNRWTIESHAVQEEGGFISIDSAGTSGYFLSNKEWLQNENRLETDTEYDARMKKEIVSSKNTIEKMLGSKVSLLSYPFSDYGQQSKNNLANAQSEISKYITGTYDFAFQQQWPYDGGFINNYPLDDHYHLKRIEVPFQWTGKDLLSFLQTGQDLQVTALGKEIPIQDGNHWKDIVGKKAEQNNNNLVLTVTPDQKNSLFILDGSRAWKNYQFNETIQFNEGDSAILYANLKSIDTDTRCVWSGGSVSIEDVMNGKVVNHVYFRDGVTSGNHVLSIVSEPGLVGCMQDGELVGAISSQNDSWGAVGVGLYSEQNSTDKITSTGVIFEPTTNIYSLQKLASDNVRSLVQNISIDDLEKKLIWNYIPVRRLLNVPVVKNYANLFEQSSWGNNTASFSSDNSNLIFMSNITNYQSGEAYWQWPIQTVSSVKEYEIKAAYTATSPSVLTIQYEHLDGSTSWSEIKELPKADTFTTYSFVVEIPEDVKSFYIMQSLMTNGTVTIQSPQINPLEDGTLDAGYVTLAFDDGRYTFKSDAMPLLKKYGMTATLAIITSHSEKKGYLSPKDLDEMAADGYEIADHTRNHVHLDNSFSPENLISEITGSKYDLELAGFNPKIFVYPYGTFSLDATSIVRRSGFIGARSVIRGFNTKNTDPFYLKDQLVDRTVPLSDISTWLKTAQDQKRWLILELHNVYPVDNPSDSESITTAQLDSILGLIKESGLSVISMEAGIKKMGSK